MYGPGFTVLSAAVMFVAGSSASALAGRMGFQALAGAAVLVVGAVLVRRRVPSGILAAVLLNPLVVVWVVNGGHNDALIGVALLLTAVALHRTLLAAAGLLLAAAVLVKATALLPALACLVWMWRRHGYRRAAVAGGSFVTPVILGYLAAGGWAAVTPMLASASSRSRVSVWRLCPVVPSCPRRSSWPTSG